MRLVRHVVALSALTCAVAFASRARAADVVITEEARTHFAAGVALLQDPKAPRYEEAYREFKAAYAASPSYKILGNLGLCAMKIERDAEAIQAYEKYLAEVGPEVPETQKEQIKKDLLTLKAGISTITISTDPPGASIVDVRNPVEGPDVRNAYGEALSPMTLSIRHGHHVVTARLTGYLDQTWEFDAVEGGTQTHVFTMVKPPVAENIVRERPIPAAAYITGAATIGLGLAGAVTGILALRKHSDYDKVNTGTSTETIQQSQNDKSSGQTLNVLTDCFLGGAIIGAGVTTYLVLTRGTTERIADVHPTLVPTVQPQVSIHGGGASARWLF